MPSSARRTKTRKPASPTPDHLARRLRDLQKRIRESKAELLLVSNPVDIRYLTGFIGEDSWLLVPERGAAVTVLSDSRFTEQIQREAPHAHALIRTGSMADELQKWLGRRKAEKLGLQSKHVTLQQRDQIGKAVGKKNLVPIDDKLVFQRAAKTQGEIRAIQRAVRIQQQAYQELLAFIEPGKTERQLAAYLEYRMRCLGAGGPSFPTIVAVDANAALPHAIPGGTKVKKNSSILIDWGAKAGGYCSDMTRTIGLGSMKPKIREIYQIVLDAQQAAIEAIRPGVSMKEIDAIARDHIAEAGYAHAFGHGLGHGIGLDIHEQPVLSPRAKPSDKLEPGQVVTVEPGIYLPGVGGVRIEDDVLVSDKGHKVLSNLPKSLESAMIELP